MLSRLFVLGDITLTPPTFDSTDSVFQSMIDTFGQAGTIAVAVIAAAVGLGVITILGNYGFGLFKKWLSKAK